MDLGADLTGWDEISVSGISADGRVIMGVGAHDGINRRGLDIHFATGAGAGHGVAARIRPYRVAGSGAPQAGIVRFSP